MQCADANECKERKKEKKLTWDARLRMALRADGPLQVIFLYGNARTEKKKHGKGESTMGSAARVGATTPCSMTVVRIGDKGIRMN